MGRKNKKGRKLRVDFRPNRQQRRRADDWTRKYVAGDESLIDAETRESVRAKGELSRKRTIIVGDDEHPLVDESKWLHGVVTRVHGLICQVRGDDGRCWECIVRRVLRTLLIQQRTPVTVGDRVWFSDQSEYHDGRAVGVIERVDERTSVLSRRDARGREQTIVANADQLLIVASIARPRLKPHLIDRYLVAAGRGGLRPVICFNKWDLLEAYEARMAEAGHGPPDDTPDVSVDYEDDYAGPRLSLEEIIGEFEQLGYRCLRTSATTGRGLDALRDELRGRTSVLAGQSGVGKSSLLNALQPGLGLAVREVSQQTEKGRHTTTLAQMFPLDVGGFVVDTPGIRGFELWNVAPGELEAYFVEFVPLVPQCRFKDCHHTGREPGCAIVAAVERGQISERRYLSYLKMLEELARERRE